MEQVIEGASQKMRKALEVLKGDLATVRTGRATPSLVENIFINAYAGTQKLRVLELATIAVSSPQILVITPYDASIVAELQKGIMEANVGLVPTVDGTVIRIAVPPLSQERRDELVKLMHQKLENGKIMIRQVRQEAMSHIKKQYNEKIISEDGIIRLEKEVQRATDEVMVEIERLGKKKEEELTQI